MGFITESQTRTDYTSLFHKQIGDTQYNLQGWLTPNGILIEVIKETMDSHSVNEEVVASQLINRRNNDSNR